MSEEEVVVVEKNENRSEKFKERAEHIRERLEHLYGDEFTRMNIEQFEKIAPEFVGWVKKYLRLFTGKDGFDKRYLMYKIDRKSGEVAYIFEICTNSNRYRISLDPAKDYMGCTVKSRIIRVGDKWARGNDLPDGNITEDMFKKILVAIVNYETVFIGN